VEVKRAAWPVSGRTRGRMVFGTLTGAFILALTAGAATLIAHMEPASLLLARRHWYRARTAHGQSAETERADAGAAAVTTVSWLGLVRAWVTAAAAGEDSLVQDTVALAAALVRFDRLTARATSKPVEDLIARDPLMVCAEIAWLALFAIGL